MALGSGLGGQLTIVAESTFGQYTSATRGLEIESETVDYVKNRKDSFALRAGGIYTRSTRTAVTTTGGAGDINLDACSRSLGLMFQSLMGSSTGPVAGTNTTLTSGGTVGSTSIVLAASSNPGDVLTIDSGSSTFETRVNLSASAGTTVTIAALNSAHTGGGASTVLVNGGSSGFIQKHTPGDTLGKSLSIQKGLPKAGGTVAAWTATGCHVDGLDLSIKADDLVKCKFTIDAQNLTDGGQSLATASYTTPSNVFGFAGGSVIVDGAMAASVVDYQQKFETKGNLARYYLNATGLKAEQIRNAAGAADGTLTLDYLDEVIPAKFFSDATATLVMCFQTTTAGEALVVTCPTVRWLTAPVQLNGPQIVQYPVTFRCYDPGATVFGTSAPVQITYVNGDAAL